MIDSVTRAGLDVDQTSLQCTINEFFDSANPSDAQCDDGNNCDNNSNSNISNTNTKPTITQIKSTLTECGLAMDPATTKLMEQLQQAKH